ncbi:hypothetical protein SAMN04488029_2491 [Reichenbachiella faecimaris]|uniref:Uncharacterized protein n=1 Tax=Reichenbachiella faecimaris TaxID=692418 RepID=A0A1W2GFE2_REIFA|nr:hypothetical protein [Reichenbachiella faecimaris]SMD35389.1 hypothetical protein SAMN04488029_2491 [Reichenbachiella faecimaris]
MQVRGSVIKSIDSFVSDVHSAKYEDWKKGLSSASSLLLSSVSTSNWYPVEPGVIAPTEVLCKMFYADKKKGAWESGRYSAKMGLTGIYKVFVLVSSPSFMLKRASRVIATFYEPTDLMVVDSSDKSMIIQFTKLPIKNELIEYRIAGWMEMALEICGCKNLKVEITKSMALGQNVFETTITWD